MTDEPKTKASGRFRIPVNCVDKTAERSGSQIAIIGGISPPAPAAPQQDGELLERDDDKASD
jgi:hypothetical protein